MADESTDSIYITVAGRSNNNINPASVKPIIQQSSNPIVEDLSAYNIYISEFTCNTSELPYFNIRRNILDFNTNRTNFAITFQSPDVGNYPFDITQIDEDYMIGIGQDPSNSSMYNGVVCFLQYTSENVNSLLYPDPTSTNGLTSIGYPLSYFNVHSIQQFLDMVNNAINKIAQCSGGTLDTNQNYFLFNASSQLYSYNTNDSEYYMWANGFLEHFLDGFRWHQYGAEIVPITNIKTSGYTGKDFLFVKSPFIKPVSTGVWVYEAESNAIAQMMDIHSIIIVASQSLGSVRKEILPLAGATTNQADPPSLPVLKSLSIDYTSLSSGSSINNGVLYYSAINLCRPITCTSLQALTQINFELFIQDIDDTLIPVQIPAVGLASIKFCLKKKLPKIAV